LDLLGAGFAARETNRADREDGDALDPSHVRLL